MKSILLLTCSLMLSATLLAGGIVTNQILSPMQVRLQARDATLGIDAVFFNPAGLNFLENDGLHLSIGNLTLGQTRTIESDYSGLNQSEYIGTVFAPIFPTVYAAYKTGNFAFSLGFNPIGGGGGAAYEDGLPTFEYQTSDLVPGLQQQLKPVDDGVETATGTNPGFSNISGYQQNVNFEGSSIFFGYQANITYKINELISVGIGARYVMAKETYTGYIRDIYIVPPTTYGIPQSAGDYLRFVGSQTGQSSVLDPAAAYMDALTADIEVDAEKSGNGITPIISVNIKASEKLNLAVKYEHQTKLELETKVNDNKDGGGLYTDGEKTRKDMPSLLVIGATYKPTDKLLISTGLHYYLDKSADYGKTDNDGNALKNADIIDNNFWEFAIGAEYNISDKLLASIGYLRTQDGVSEDFQSDLDHSLSSNSIGGGFEYQFTPMINVNLAGQYTKYIEDSKSFNHDLGGSGMLIPVTETYNRDAWIVAVGVNLSFSAGK